MLRGRAASWHDPCQILCAAAILTETVCIAVMQAPADRRAVRLGAHSRYDICRYRKASQLPAAAAQQAQLLKAAAATAPALPQRQVL